jgi:two-component system, cell cycle sensor histidine kinase and response regulator CckA
VRGHHGALKVYSSPGEGTTFKVLLPAAIPAPQQPEERLERRELGGTGTILVVDDEAIVRKTAVASLERYGYHVITAEDGYQGVSRFTELHADLSLVILDMTMPVMSGGEALRRMRTINPGVPVVLSSGFNEMEAIQRFTGEGLAGFIQKPYTVTTLAEKIRAVLQGSNLAKS